MTSSKPGSHSGSGADDPASLVSPEVAGAVAEAVRSATNGSDAIVPDTLLTTDEWEHLSRRDQRLLKGIFERIARRESLVRDADAEFRESRTAGERIADRMAQFGGSWPFILLFVGFLGVWVALNVMILSDGTAFDPYPFIFLNLLLSMLAALQAPVIMMSQNRQAQRDRAAAENDYAVNLRAEVEIRELHDKLDELRENQWMSLVALQQEQIKMLELLCSMHTGSGEPPTNRKDAKNS